MKLPNVEHAYIDLRKLTDYVLNMEHAEGYNKAVVFASALGITAEHADILKDALLSAIQTHEAILGEKNKFGQR